MIITGTKKGSQNMSHRYLRKQLKVKDVYLQCRVVKKRRQSCGRRDYNYVSFHGTRKITGSLTMVLTLQGVGHHYLHSIKVSLTNAQLTFSGSRGIFFTPELNRVDFRHVNQRCCFQGHIVVYFRMLTRKTLLNSPKEQSQTNRDSLKLK